MTTNKIEYKIGDIIYVDTSQKHGEFGIITSIQHIDVTPNPYNLYNYKVIAWENGKPKKSSFEHQTTDYWEYTTKEGYPTGSDGTIKIMPAKDYIERKKAELNEVLNNLSKIIK